MIVCDICRNKSENINAGIGIYFTTGSDKRNCRSDGDFCDNCLDIISRRIKNLLKEITGEENDWKS